MLFFDEFSDINDNSADLYQPAWDDMVDILDTAEQFYPDDVLVENNALPTSYSVVRLVLRKAMPSEEWESWIQVRPLVHRRNNSGDQVNPYSYIDPSRQAVVFWPQDGDHTLDLLTWRSQIDDQHANGHPENLVVDWLQDQARTNPNFTGAIRQVNMAIQGQPCNSCLGYLKTSLKQILPLSSHVNIRWVKPLPKFQSFRERRYQPKIARWDR